MPQTNSLPEEAAVRGRKNQKPACAGGSVAHRQKDDQGNRPSCALPIESRVPRILPKVGHAPAACAAFWTLRRPDLLYIVEQRPRHHFVLRIAKTRFQQQYLQKVTVTAQQKHGGKPRFFAYAHYAILGCKHRLCCIFHEAKDILSIWKISLRNMCSIGHWP